MRSRYQPLADYLAALPPETGSVTLSFPAIEVILGKELPAGASTVAWWSTARAAHTPRPWLVAGWRTVGLRLRQTPRVVTFVRADLPP